MFKFQMQNPIKALAIILQHSQISIYEGRFNSFFKYNRWDIGKILYHARTHQRSIVLGGSSVGKLNLEINWMLRTALLVNHIIALSLRMLTSQISAGTHDLSSPLVWRMDSWYLSFSNSSCHIIYWTQQNGLGRNISGSKFFRTNCFLLSTKEGI